MYELDILNDCLLEIPSVGSFNMWSHKKVNEPLFVRTTSAWRQDNLLQHNLRNAQKPQTNVIRKSA